MEITVKIEIGEAAVTAFMALAELFSQNKVQAVTIQNPGAAITETPKPMTNQQTPVTETPQPVTQPVTQPVSQQPPTTVPTAVPTAVLTAVPTAERMYTMEELGQAGAAIMETVGQAALQNLVRSFGVASLSELPAEHYGAFALKLREMGAKI